MLSSTGAFTESEGVVGRIASVDAGEEAYIEAEGREMEGAGSCFASHDNVFVDDVPSHDPPSPSNSSTTHECPSFDDGSSSSDCVSSDEDEDGQDSDDFFLQSNASCSSLSLSSAFYKIDPSTFLLPITPFSNELCTSSFSLLTRPSLQTSTSSAALPPSAPRSDHWADSDDYDPFAGPDTFPSFTTSHLVTLGTSFRVSQDWADEDDEAFFDELPVLNDEMTSASDEEEAELEEGELLEARELLNESERDSEEDSEDEEAPFAVSLPTIDEEAANLDDERFVDLTSLRRPFLRNYKLGGSMREQRLGRAAIYSSLIWKGMLRGDEPWLRW